MDIRPLFPQLIFSATIPVPNGLVEYCDELKKGKTENRTSGGGWETPNNLQENKKFVDKYLKAHFLVPLQRELSTVKFPSWNLDALWISGLNKGGYHVDHIHPCADFAFTWYINAYENAEGGCISFRNPMEYESSKMLHYLDSEIKNALGLCHNFQIKPKSGLFLMFPAYLYHMVLPSGSDNRLAMSGNITIG